MDDEWCRHVSLRIYLLFPRNQAEPSCLSLQQPRPRGPYAAFSESRIFPVMIMLGGQRNTCRDAMHTRSRIDELAILPECSCIDYSRLYVASKESIDDTVKVDLMPSSRSNTLINPPGVDTLAGDALRTTVAGFLIFKGKPFSRSVRLQQHGSRSGDRSAKRVRAESNAIQARTRWSTALQPA